MINPHCCCFIELDSLNIQIGDRYSTISFLDHTSQTFQNQLLSGIFDLIKSVADMQMFSGKITQ